MDTMHFVFCRFRFYSKARHLSLLLFLHLLLDTVKLPAEYSTVLSDFWHSAQDSEHFVENAISNGLLEKVLHFGQLPDGHS
jgi:hypothetical protein